MFRLAHPIRLLILLNHHFLIFWEIRAKINLPPFNYDLLPHGFLKNLGNHPQLHVCSLYALNFAPCFFYHHFLRILYY